MSTRPAVVVDDVSKRFRLYRERNQSLKAALMRGRRAVVEEFWALQDVSFEVPEGSTFGLVGENGSGKSTLMKCMARILQPDRGSVRVNGKVSALLELGAGFHPELSGRENVFLNGSILGLGQKELAAKFDEIVEFAGLGQFIDQPVKNYSNGMYVRLGFSVAINVDPDVLLVDEVLAVGDEAFQRKCNEKFADLKAAGKTIVLVSHNLSAVHNLCDRAAWLEHGVLKMIAPARQIVDEYMSTVQIDRVEDVETGGNRWGSGEGRIEKVELLGPSGEPASKVRTGDPVTIRIHYCMDEPIPRPVFGLAIHTLDGTHVTGPNTRDTESVPDKLEGEGHVDLRIDPIRLLPGTYDITASLYDYACLHPYDFRHHVLRFDVDPGEPHESYGVVSLGGSWRVPGVDPAA
ncbi:MAG: Teichoic acid export ATP-binding protein TagH [uncultured Acidimicrobiales bacterium]|uniref:Teichoic acid export ATP-binding protein TagH n=1 Tax=uncultured Acidimicrobiales bacterium TaxID=310071 RepID=A0A6J4I1L0_9ACTN|nr:MAG: Teichoic acid export ATP-binding protein TagH [uncultured Acidimicrobiales bacterium]